MAITMLNADVHLDVNSVFIPSPKKDRSASYVGNARSVPRAFEAASTGWLPVSLVGERQPATRVQVTRTGRRPDPGINGRFC
jgi:hypothetical protein